jgi:hypothetical protein
LDGPSFRHPKTAQVLRERVVERLVPESAGECWAGAVISPEQVEPK